MGHQFPQFFKHIFLHYVILKGSERCDKCILEIIYLNIFHVSINKLIVLHNYKRNLYNLLKLAELIYNNNNT